MVSKQSYLKNNKEKKNCETETIQLALCHCLFCHIINEIQVFLLKTAWGVNN